MNDELPSQWKETFSKLLESDPRAPQLKEASLQEDLGKWTILLTGMVTDNCRALGWTPAAMPEETAVCLQGGNGIIHPEKLGCLILVGRVGNEPGTANLP